MELVTFLKLYQQQPQHQNQQQPQQQNQQQLQQKKQQNQVSLKFMFIQWFYFATSRFLIILLGNI